MTVLLILTAVAHRRDGVFCWHIQSFMFVTLCKINKHNQKLDFVSQFVEMTGSVTSYKSKTLYVIFHDIQYVTEY